jgi:hypothetical protein
MLPDRERGSRAIAAFSLPDAVELLHSREASADAISASDEDAWAHLLPLHIRAFVALN